MKEKRQPSSSGNEAAQLRKFVKAVENGEKIPPVKA